MEYPQKPEGFPEAIISREGSKVGWKTYSTREEAEIASKYYRVLASYKAGQGYDFGYQVPGEIREDAGGVFVVTTP